LFAGNVSHKKAQRETKVNGNHSPNSPSLKQSFCVFLCPFVAIIAEGFATKRHKEAQKVDRTRFCVFYGRKLLCITKISINCATSSAKQALQSTNIIGTAIWKKSTKML